MSAPPKPWERAGVNSQSSPVMGSTGLPPCCTPGSSAMPTGMPASVGGGLPQTVNPPPPPPLPERPSTYGGAMSGYGGLSSYGGMGSYGGGMYGGGLGGYGGGMYGGGMGSGMYGGGMYGGAGYGTGMYGGYGMGGANYAQNSFVQQAEENSRQAFESIGSVVQVFSSIAMMLDSTFQAVYNSFRAVIGVADQFGRMKAHLTQLLSAMAVIRAIKWFVKKMLVMLRLRAAGLPEDVWKQAAAEEGANIVAAAGGNGKSWPIFMFFAVVFGGPWVIWKLLAQIGGNDTARKWTDGTSDHFLAVAEYDFTGQGEQELSFHRGQKIIVAPKELQPNMRGWLLACVDGKKEGIIPADYVKVMGKRKGKTTPPPPPPQASQLQPQASPLHAPVPQLQAPVSLSSPAVVGEAWEGARKDQDTNAWDAAFQSNSASISQSSTDVLEKNKEEPKKCCGHCKD